MSTTTDEDADRTETASESKVSDEPGQQPRTVSIRLSTVLVTAAICVLTTAAVTFAALYWSARSTIADRDAKAADDRHAEQVATDYSLGASTIDYHDVKGWLGRLQAGTTPSSRPSSTPPPRSSSRSCCRCSGHRKRHRCPRP